jgi:hypothetical protein
MLTIGEERRYAKRLRKRSTGGGEARRRRREGEKVL